MGNTQSTSSYFKFESNVFVYWARIDKIYYANTKEDAADINFDDDFIYKEFDKDKNKRSIPTEQLCINEAIEVFKKWLDKSDKIEY